MSENAHAATGKSATKHGFLGHIALLIRQVIDELRKIVWPTMDELWTYFTVVVVSVIAIVTFTGVLGFTLNRAVMWLSA